MTVEQAFSEAYGRMVNDPEGALDVIGERISALEQENADRQAQIDAQARHISELETSLENARKERDEHEAMGNKHIAELRARQRDIDEARNERDEWQRRWQDEDDAARHAREALQVERAEHEATRKERDEYRTAAHHATMDAVDARLKPSGQVAEDERALRMEIQGYIERYGGREEALAYFHSLLAALSRLAAKAHGYEAAVQRAKELEDLGNKTLKEYQHAERERIAAVADNAAMLDLFAEVARSPRPRGEPACAWCGTQEHDPKCPVGRALSQPHSGAALLERMKRLENDARRLSDGLRATHHTISMGCASDALPPISILLQEHGH